ncbi:4-hydroxy-3-methylbut-2-enyl diphosphate reductase [Catellatospora coxensis]|uniref:4-hydroxy-3-methylbut-2-enyl diphosphate reductase n=1 Tax=Catellatospora coxensis TaxID=310354 RepID=A0A8J3P8A8_9ACTN|nr:4-hydroxy-3-methylbut-2-enyl diphosphate reductase [Catellatospora coxensis]GIG07203.1 4-hydroxy-3-methylbut-2-enyl diphosphate reductase [Catellatospora coxensis]
MGTVLLAEPRAFCAGVSRAVATVERTLELHGAPVFVRREIVHNRHVVQRLRDLGAVFVAEVDEVPAGARLILSAHGVSPQVRQAANGNRLQVVDATCPLVTKVHREARRYADEGYSILLIGQADHDEVIGTLGEAPDRIQVVDHSTDIGALHVPDPAKVVWLAQTTLVMSDTMRIVARLRTRFPHLIDPPSDDICYAAQNRQTAVSRLVERADLVLVVGSANSHNSRALVDVAAAAGKPAYLINDESDLRPQWLTGVKTLGLTGGASAPESVIQSVLAALVPYGFDHVDQVTAATENQQFALPRELEPDR